MKIIWVTILILIILVGGYFLLMRDSGVVAKPEVTQETTEPEPRIVEKMEIDEKTSLVFKSGYSDYSESEILPAGGKIVLFFHARWCPYCRSLDNSLKNSLSKIPSDLLILKADYDSETTLKQKYGVTYQHTLVQIDDKGNQITKWSGSENLSQILSKIK